MLLERSNAQLLKDLSGAVMCVFHKPSAPRRTALDFQRMWKIENALVLASCDSCCGIVSMPLWYSTPDTIAARLRGQICMPSHWTFISKHILFPEVFVSRIDRLAHSDGALPPILYIVHDHLQQKAQNKAMAKKREA